MREDYDKPTHCLAEILLQYVHAYRKYVGIPSTIGLSGSEGRAQLARTLAETARQQSLSSIRSDKVAASLAVDRAGIAPSQRCDVWAKLVQAGWGEVS
jgi:hypothetical protein